MVWILSRCCWQTSVVCVGICGSTCHIQPLLQLILFEWVVRLTYSTENKILHLTTPCSREAVPCVYSCLGYRFQFFRSLGSALCFRCTISAVSEDVQPCGSGSSCRLEACSWCAFGPFDVTLNFFSQSSISENLEMSALLFVLILFASLFPYFPR